MSVTHIARGIFVNIKTTRVVVDSTFYCLLLYRRHVRCKAKRWRLTKNHQAPLRPNSPIHFFIIPGSILQYFSIALPLDFKSFKARAKSQSLDLFKTTQRQSQYSQIDKYRTDPGGQFPGISNTYTAIERYLETDQHFPSSIFRSIFTRINPLFRRNLFYRANIYNNTRNGRWVGRANAGRDAGRQLLLARRRKRARTVASTTLRV